jgi:hypothetical protein
MALSKEAQRLKDIKPENMTSEDYDGRWDAQTLANAEVIKADPDRLKRAIAWAELLSFEENQQAKAMQAVAAISTT